MNSSTLKEALRNGVDESLASDGAAVRITVADVHEAVGYLQAMLDVDAERQIEGGYELDGAEDGCGWCLQVVRPSQGERDE